MTIHLPKIYLACSLTHAPQEFREEMEALRTILRKQYRVLDFMGLEKGSAQEVFKWDMYCVTSCDLLVSECSYPSIGLGMEIGMAFMSKKPSLAVAKKDAKVTRMLLGMHYDDFKFIRYNKIDEIVREINKMLKYYS